MNCRKFFDSNAENKSKCKLLQEIPEEDLLAWELQEASEFSPGIVKDSEVLYQQIVDPTHLDPNGRALKPTAFDSSSSFGLSVNRLAHSSWEALVDRGRKRAEKYNLNNPESPQRTLWGFAPFRAEEVRRIVSPFLKHGKQSRGFFIYDTANFDDNSHADICQCVKDEKKKRSVRFSLYDLAKDALIRIENDNNKTTTPPKAA